MSRILAQVGPSFSSFTAVTDLCSACARSALLYLCLHLLLLLLLLLLQACGPLIPLHVPLLVAYRLRWRVDSVRIDSSLPSSLAFSKNHRLPKSDALATPLAAAFLQQHCATKCL